MLPTKNTLPNMLTYGRIILIPCFIIAYYLPFPGMKVIAAALFLIGGFTDWFDGYLARKLDQTSRFGAFLDPVADKLMVAAALLLIVSSYGSPLIAIPSIVIVSREILISALREWMAEVGKSHAVRVSKLGKYKTFLQIAAIAILLSQPVTTNLLTIIGIVGLYAAAGITLWSMYIYLQEASASIAEDAPKANEAEAKETHTPVEAAVTSEKPENPEDTAPAENVKAPKKKAKKNKGKANKDEAEITAEDE